MESATHSSTVPAAALRKSRWRQPAQHRERRNDSKNSYKLELLHISTSAELWPNPQAIIFSIRQRCRRRKRRHSACDALKDASIHEHSIV